MTAKRNKLAAERPGKGGSEGELLDLDQAVALLKTTRPTFYRWLRTGRIKGMRAGRQWRFYRADLERFIKGQEPHVELPADINPLLETLRARLAETGYKGQVPPSQNKLAGAVDLMILAARQSRASDLHLEAQFDPPAGGQVAVLRIRIDGALHPLARFDVRLLSPVVERWKALAACDVHEHKRPQDGRIAMQLGPTKSLDLRVCFLPTLFGEAVTVRLLVPEQVNLDLSRIDYAAADRDRLLKALDAPHGMIIVTGPTGCGKTTVLYSCLTHLARPSCKVMSVEDPVEFVLPGVTQSQVMPNAGFGFPQALRAILRSDPDVVMVGEIRDAETMQLCCQTALTGHVVLSTLHAEDAALALRRIVDIGVPPFVVAGSLRLVLSQRLVRLVCPKCGRAKTPPQNVLATARELAGAGGLNFQELSPDFRSPVGCRDCGGVGYRGRTVIAETLEMSSAVASALQRGAPADELRRIAVAEGMATMAADGIRRAAAGQTTLDEVLSTLPIR